MYVIWAATCHHWISVTTCCTVWNVILKNETKYIYIYCYCYFITDYILFLTHNFLHATSFNSDTQLDGNVIDLSMDQTTSLVGDIQSTVDLIAGHDQVVNRNPTVAEQGTSLK